MLSSEGLTDLVAVFLPWLVGYVRILREDSRVKERQVIYNEYWTQQPHDGELREGEKRGEGTLFRK